MIEQETIKKEILERLGIEGLPPEAQNEIIAIATGSILQSVSAAVLSKMPEDAQRAFTDAFVNGDGAKAEDLLRTHIPDADAFVASEISKATEEFRQLYTQGK